MAYQRKGLVLFLFFAVIQNAASLCKISLSPDILSVNKPDGPLIFKYAYDNTASFHYPSDSDCLFPSEDKQLNLACPGHDNVMQFYQKAGNKMIVVNATFSSVVLRHITNNEYVRVVGGPSMFKVASGNYIRCLRRPVSAMNKKYNVLQVNHMANDVDQLGVYNQYSTDFPSWEDQSTITAGLINPAIQKRSVVGDDNVYEKGLFYRNKTLDFSELYSKEHQRARFEGYFLDPDMTEQYFAGDNSLVVGQLLFKEDMFYPAQQMSTFYYENTVPIWKSIYEGNWRSIGNIIRKTVIGTDTEMRVYAFTWPSYQAKKMKTWTLGNTTTSPDRVPVPKILAKVVYDSNGNKDRGVVFHTFNDPHLDLKVAAEKIKDYCSSTINCSDQHPEFEDVYKGYTFCCTATESNIVKKLWALKFS